MALREPRDILHKGKRLDEILDAHARWLANRAEGRRADLAGAKLFAARLPNAILAYADLSGADLQRASLPGADLQEAELAEADLRESLLRDAALHKAVLSRAQLHRAKATRADFRESLLDGSDLVGTDLRGARLGAASITKSRFFRADLRGADLTRAQLEETELVETHLGAAILRETNLTRSKLLGADLRGAQLTRTELPQAKFEQALFGHTRIRGCDLGRAMGLETSRHLGPTWLDAETLTRSGKNLPGVFLYGAGIPASEAAGQNPGPATEDEGDISFVGFAKRDVEFAERLRLDLMANGLRCWFLPQDARWEGIDLGRPPYDRLVLVCSRNSLQNSAVLRELGQALDRERKEGAGILFPVRIDDYVLEEWEHARKDELLRRTVGDFRNWKDGDLYGAALHWLLAQLRPQAPPTGTSDSAAAPDQV